MPNNKLIHFCKNYIKKEPNKWTSMMIDMCKLCSEMQKVCTHCFALDGADVEFVGVHDAAVGRRTSSVPAAGAESSRAALAAGLKRRAKIFSVGRERHKRRRRRAHSLSCAPPPARGLQRTRCLCFRAHDIFETTRIKVE